VKARINIAISLGLRILILALCTPSIHGNGITFLGDVLEIGAQWSVRTKDIPSFERYMAQLQTYYNDHR
jgi:26S proteasome regulatory subunit N12